MFIILKEHNQTIQVNENALQSKYFNTFLYLILQYTNKLLREQWDTVLFTTTNINRIMK